MDRDRRITYWDKGAERITGYPECYALGKRCSEILQHCPLGKKDALCEQNCPLKASMDTGNPGGDNVAARLRRPGEPDVEKKKLWVRTYPLRIHGEVVGGIEVFGEEDGKREADFAWVKVPGGRGRVKRKDLKNLADELSDHSSWAHEPSSLLTLTETSCAHHVVKVDCTPKRVRYPGSSEIVVPLYFYDKESPEHTVSVSTTKGAQVATLSEPDAARIAALALAQVIKENKKKSLATSQWAYIQLLTRHHPRARECEKMLRAELHPLDDNVVSLIRLLSRSFLRFALLPEKQAGKCQVLTCTAEVPQEGMVAGSTKAATDGGSSGNNPASTPAEAIGYTDSGRAPSRRTRPWWRIVGGNFLVATGYSSFGFRLRGIPEQDSRVRVAVEGELERDIDLRFLSLPSSEERGKGRVVMVDVPVSRLWPALLTSLGTFLLLGSLVGFPGLPSFLSALMGIKDLTAVFSMLVLAPTLTFVFLVRPDRGFVSRKLHHVRSGLALISLGLLFAAALIIIAGDPIKGGPTLRPCKLSCCVASACRFISCNCSSSSSGNGYLAWSLSGGEIVVILASIELLIFLTLLFGFFWAWWRRKDYPWYTRVLDNSCNCTSRVPSGATRSLRDFVDGDSGHSGKCCPWVRFRAWWHKKQLERDLRRVRFMVQTLDVGGFTRTSS